MNVSDYLSKDNRDIKFHILLNTITFSLSFLKFYRNSHYFKLSRDLYSKYWGGFILFNASFYILSGFILLGKNFGSKYKKVKDKILDY